MSKLKSGLVELMLVLGEAQAKRPALTRWCAGGRNGGSDRRSLNDSLRALNLRTTVEI